MKINQPDTGRWQMKGTIFAAAILLSGAGAFAQGEVYVSNVNPIFFLDGLSLLGPPTGTTYVEQLVVNGVEIPASISPVNQGYFYGPDPHGIVTLANTPVTSIINIQVEVWDITRFPTFAAAANGFTGAILGLSPMFTYEAGGTETPAPPLAPAPLQFGTAAFGMGTGILIPEPLPIALGAMGLGASLLFRRRTQALA